MDIKKILSGQIVLEETSSPKNGNIKVIKDLVFGTYIQVDGLTQSGGIIYSIWGETLKHVFQLHPRVNNALILGLGGGTLSNLIRKHYPKTKITGVDIDPVIVGLGKKYMKLDESGVKIVIKDAYDFMSEKNKLKTKKYDLLIVDTYRGTKYPSKMESDDFLKLILSNITDNGMVIFNRLYFKAQRSPAVKFGNKLEKFFSKVEWFYPEANLMLICSNN